MRRVTRPGGTPVGLLAALLLVGAPSPGEAKELLVGESSLATVGGPEWFQPGGQRWDAEWEGLFGNDVIVNRVATGLETKWRDLTLGGTFSYTDLEVDYREPGTFATARSEANLLGQLDLSWEPHPEWEVTTLVRAYEGFPDYRAVWIAEYYEQLFGFVPGYRTADPGGWAVGAGVAWQVDPGATRVSIDLGFGRDEIVEGWEFGPGRAVPGRSELETLSAGATWEQAVNGWLKSETSVRIQKVTAREPRWQVQSQWAAALSVAWTLQADAGLTRERPHFEAYYAGALLDYEFQPGWHLAVGTRYYEDSGEIESSGFSTAAPGMQSFEVMASLLVETDDLAVRLSGGFYNSDFEPLDPTNDFFANLYRDRDWWLTRLAVSYRF